MPYRCKHCVHSLTCTIQDTRILFCSKRDRYCPSPAFVEAWGCDEFEDRQLSLFKEEKGGSYGNNKKKSS